MRSERLCSVLGFVCRFFCVVVFALSIPLLLVLLEVNVDVSIRYGNPGNSGVCASSAAGVSGVEPTSKQPIFLPLVTTQQPKSFPFCLHTKTQQHKSLDLCQCVCVCVSRALLVHFS